MTFTVESGIEMPKRARGRAPTKFPIADMAVGDSFLIPCDIADKKALTNWRRKFLVAKQTFLKHFEGEFKTATMSDGVRVWRTA
jgi:hypothetical protein